MSDVTISSDYLRWLETAAHVVCSLRIQQLTGPQDQQVTSWVSDPQYAVYRKRKEGAMMESELTREQVKDIEARSHLCAAVTLPGDDIRGLVALALEALEARDEC